MTDQSQTNQPKLSLEEELDVLEAVYKIGREKGLELLRPEQVKKLRDAGRVFTIKTDKPFSSDQLNSIENKIYKSLSDEDKYKISKLGEVDKSKFLVSILFELLHISYPECFSGETYEALSKQDKKKFEGYFFKLMFGNSPEYLALKLAYSMRGKHVR